MQVTPCMFLAILWIACLIPLCSALTKDGSILLDFRKRIQTDPHGILLKWNGTDTTPCHWPGIGCVNGLVKTLNLSNQFLEGYLEPKLGLIPTLQQLLLGGNHLHGSIPKQLGDLGQLRVLDLHGNELKGRIPPEICKASNLMKLLLGSNRINGTIPKQLGTLKKLRILELSGNNLTGIIPPEVGNASNLTTLILGSNLLAGIIPKQLGGLRKLSMLDLSGNKLTGVIPTELGNPSNLTKLLLGGNHLHGSIPKQLGDLEQLRVLDLCGNELKDKIPPEICKASNLTKLLLGSNHINGTIPKQLGMLKKLRVLDLSGNKLTGMIPPEVGNASNLTTLYLYNNHLHGKVPAELGNLHKLQQLRLDRNGLGGDIPFSSDCAVTKHMQNKTIHLGHLFNSNTGGSIQFKGLCLLRNLSVGNFSYNYMTGQIPFCLHLSSESFEWNCFNTLLSRQRPHGECGYVGSFRSSYPGSLHQGGQENHQSRWKKHIQSAIAAASCLSLLVFIFFLFRYGRGKATAIPSWMLPADIFQKTFITVVPAISRAELEVACEDFSNIIGSSHAGVVFKGTLSDGTEIAVTDAQGSMTSWSHELEIYFRYKVDRLARVDHKHVLKLLSYCSEDQPFTRMLVFEYTPNGTLYDLLHNGEGEHLDWNARMRIIMGVAYGLEYMHHTLSPPATYSKFDSSSVLLTEDFAAKLAGFEVGKPSLVKRSSIKPTHVTEKNAARSFSFLENTEGESSDFEANIFGFGILILELISGRPAHRKDKGSLLEWAVEYLHTPEVIAYMVDPMLRFFNYNQLENLCEIIRLCIGVASMRPCMKKVTSMLETTLGITSEAAGPRQSPLLWAELAILSQM